MTRRGLEVANMPLSVAASYKIILVIVQSVPRGMKGVAVVWCEPVLLLLLLSKAALIISVLLAITRVLSSAAWTRQGSSFSSLSAGSGEGAGNKHRTRREEWG